MQLPRLQFSCNHTQLLPLTLAPVAAQHEDVPPHSKVLAVAAPHVRHHRAGRQRLDEGAHLGPHRKSVEGRWHEIGVGMGQRPRWEGEHVGTMENRLLASVAAS